MCQYMRTRSVGKNNGVLKVPTIQAPGHTETQPGLFFLGITEGIENHESATTLTGHCVLSRSLSSVSLSLCQVTVSFPLAVPTERIVTSSLSPMSGSISELGMTSARGSIRQHPIPMP